MLKHLSNILNLFTNTLHLLSNTLAIYKYPYQQISMLCQIYKYARHIFQIYLTFSQIYCIFFKLIKGTTTNAWQIYTWFLGFKSSFLILDLLPLRSSNQIDMVLGECNAPCWWWGLFPVVVVRVDVLLAAAGVRTTTSNTVTSSGPYRGWSWSSKNVGCSIFKI